MSLNPCKDWNWSPGVLSDEQVKQLGEGGFIEDLSGAQYDLDGSSFDLHLTDVGYMLKHGTIKPCGDRYHNILKNDQFVEPLVIDDQGIFTPLEPGNSYVFKIKERLHFREEYNIYGQATARSSVGRVDVLARLIVDGMDSYEGFSPGCISGDLYIEIIPATFKVRVQAGKAVSQLRLFYGKPSISEIRINKESNFGWLVSKEGNRGDSLCVDLTPTKINGSKASVFWVEKEGKNLAPIDLWNKENESDKPKPEDYWKKQEVNNERLEIKQGNFYILRSIERIALPRGVAVYCRAIDETIGEMRIHYAGFAHPSFGLNRSDGKEGTPLIFEVRGHGANVNLKHGEKLAKLVFYRMSEEPKKPQEKYNEQELELSSFFQPWK